MKKYTCLITGAGAPGIWGACQSLKDYRLIGTDIRPDVVGKFFMEKVYQVSKPTDPEYQNQIKKIVEEEKVDLIVPLTTHELNVLAMMSKDLPVLCDSWSNMDILNNKFKLFEVLKDCDFIANYFLAKDGLIVKPVFGSGEDGYRRVRNKGIVMEYLPGKEYSVDCLAKKGESIVIVPRTRDLVRDGITFEGTTVNHGYIINACKEIIKRLSINGIVGFQFREDTKGNPKLIDCNPRYQGSMYHSQLAGVNILEGAVKQFLEGDSGLLQDQVEWGIKLKTYWGRLKG